MSNRGRQTKAQRLENDDFVLQMRLSGMSWAEIAANPATEYETAAGAWKAGKRALDRVIEETQPEYVTIASARFDAMLAAVWTRVLKGEDAAIKIAMLITDKQMRLYGLGTGGGITFNANTQVNNAPVPKPGDDRLALPAESYTDFEDRSTLGPARDYIEAEFREVSGKE